MRINALELASEERDVTRELRPKEKQARLPIKIPIKVL
jgi:hypothetical protein